MFSDLHAHLNDPKFDGEENEVAEDCIRARVGIVVNAGYDMKSSEKALMLSEKFPFMYFTAGIHPDNAAELDEKNEKRLREMLSHPKCVGAGEIGYDFHWNVYPREMQERAFVRQAELAAEEGIPFVVHSREASAATMKTLKEHKDLLHNGFVLHCYAESAESAKEYLKLGAYFTFGGVITFKNAKKDDIIRSIPLTRVMTETDSPYLAPHPLRGTLNTPANIPLIAEKLASVYGVTAEDIGRETEKNAKNLFKRLQDGHDHL